MSLRIVTTTLNVLPMQTRMPFRYGIATLTALPHLFVQIEAEIDGERTIGVASDGLAPKWFTKNPATTTEHDIAEMLHVIQAAATFARDCGTAPSVFAFWQRLYAAQHAWGAAQGYPPLLWHFGVSLIERTLIDAWCRVRGTSFGAAVRDGSLGLDLGALHTKLRGLTPADLLPAHPCDTIIARHTVGLGDPLTDDEITPDERIDDGLPQSLVACITTYGLTHFKIKLHGDEEQDVARLRRIAAVLDAAAPGARCTLDGNEQFQTVQSFRALWQALHRDHSIASLMQRLLFVEQPLHRDVALSDETARALVAWTERPSMIIDESDGDLASLPRALESGYAGTSHKNCKGIFKGVANACLLVQRQRANPAQHSILSGEDLCNVGPVALLQDLAVMATLGIAHVERNGHHYFKGLSMYSQDVQERVLQQHPDLYCRHADGFAALNVRDGSIAVGSVVAAPFGLAYPFDSSRYERVTGTKPGEHIRCCPSP